MRCLVLFNVVSYNYFRGMSFVLEQLPPNRPNIKFEKITENACARNSLSRSIGMENSNL